MIFTLLQKFLNIKKFCLVLTPHGGYTPEWSVFNKIQALIKRTYSYTIGTWLINKTIDGFRAVSQWEKVEVIKHGVVPEKVVTISNGIEDEAYLDLENLASEEIKRKVNLWGKYIIQVGRVYPIKNYETTIKALTKCPTDLNYLIVGPIHEDEKNKNYKLELDKLISDLGLTDRIIFSGVIRGVDKFYVIKHAQMMVHMAIWESFCNVVHEGLSQGLICLVANNTALPLLVKDGVNGYCIDTFDDKKLSEKINLVLKNRESKFFKAMIKINKEFGSETRWSKVAERMASLYLKLIKN